MVVVAGGFNFNIRTRRKNSLLAGGFPLEHHSVLTGRGVAGNSDVLGPVWRSFVSKIPTSLAASTPTRMGIIPFLYERCIRTATLTSRFHNTNSVLECWQGALIVKLQNHRLVFILRS